MGKNGFHYYLIKMLEYFNLRDFNSDLLDTAVVGLIKQQYTGINILHDSQKLAFHRSFKTDHTPSNYLRDGLTRGTAGRICKITNKQSQTNDRT